MFMNNEPEWYYGPGADHTLNSVNGHYLYVDDTYSEFDQKAIIRSPTYQMAARRCIFSMWYYVYGVDMGTLKVLQYTPSNDRNYNLMTVVDIGEDMSTKDRWNLYEVQVEACAENFQLSIEAKDRNDYFDTGGYAIDDLRFEGCAYTLPLPPGGSCDADTEETCDSGHCYPKSERCDYTPNCCDGTDESTQNCADYRMCDFETNMCYWGQLTDDTLDWTRKTGGTGTGDTGPWKDHTTFSNNGYFIYTEVDDAFPGDTYRIGSFYIQPTSSGCEIRFYHHMRGSGIGTLNLYTRTKIDGPMTRLWYSDTAHGNYWLYQRVSLTSEDAFQVVFEGVRGSTNLGDIALDDITFTPECVESKEPLPPADVIPTQPNHCELGMRPCDIDQCIDESYYCDFNPDCPVGGEDELYCPSTCDFDTVGILSTCYWSQDVKDDFDWSWFNAPEMEDSYNGPRYDHTTASTSGHYIYVDGTISSINTYAKLVSPIYKKTNRGCTFSMYYYMFGVEYGDLEIRLIDQEGMDIRLTKVGDNALDYNKWILSESLIPACTKNFQIVIEAEDKQVLPTEGGFAVDDIAMKDCYYAPEVDPGSCGLQAQCDAGECYPAENQCDFTQDCCDMSDEDPQTCNLGKSVAAEGFTVSVSTIIHRRWESEADKKRVDEINYLMELAASENRWGLIINNDISEQHLGRDGVHLNRAGQRILAGNLKRLINSADQPTTQGHGWTQRSSDQETGSEPGARRHQAIYRENQSLHSDEEKGSPLGYSLCNFEIDLCYWEQLTTDEFDWRRNQGDTSSEGTGPEVDHTFGTDEGYYIYTEASNPRKLGERARLASFTIAGSRISVCSVSLATVLLPPVFQTVAIVRKFYD
ncbi:MAM and LDL-receptor class A domain-containing protein 1-like [Strongylocentrotus purpuratus]|uniref:MAM domain-containing protein n=1 Tax=Strongylocentrotus purpuratus TaxID=7668 RepID=A0A7M7PLP0_STRPU|nr:MAM and LDL-receptor class A domain-containing protein 1-like [Strongylocentrotus purpuratus]